MAAFLACVGFASCSQDELADNRQGTPLPAGQYPLELTVGELEAVATPAQPATRGTFFEGDWDGVQSVMVQDGENVPKAYHITAKGDNKTATLSSDDPFWWTNVIETKTVTAWHPAKYPDDESINFANRIPVQGDKWSVPADQSMEDFDVSAYDFIYAYEEIPFANHEDARLEFRHLLSKVVVNLEKSEYLSANSNDVSVSLINCALSGTFKYSGEDLSLRSGYQDKRITMRKVATNDDAFASYDALVFPQGVSDRNINVLVQVGTTSYTWHVQMEDNMFYGGICYTFNITVDAKVLNVTVEESIGWNPDGATGNGSITLP